MRYGPDTIDKNRSLSIRFPKSIFWSIIRQNSGREEIEPQKGVMLSRVCLPNLNQDFLFELLEAYLIDELAQTLLLGMVLVIVDYSVDKR